MSGRRGEATREIQERVGQTLADLELVDRLEEIRTRSGTPWGPSQQLLARTDQEYGDALRNAGIDIDALSVEQAVNLITSRREIAAALLPALDDWVAVRNWSGAGAKIDSARRLIDVLQQADPDPWRQQLRNMVSRDNWPALKDLATPTELDRQPAATLYLLYAAMRVHPELFDEGELVLRRAQWKYPDDFWINHRLGVNLMWEQSPERVLEGMGYMRAAVAVRPQSAHAVMNLGNGYQFLGQNGQAVACYRKALEFAPSYWGCRSSLGVSLSRMGLFDEAIMALEQAITDGSETSSEAYAELSMIHSCRPESHLRDAGRATELASKAVEIEPGFCNSWTALGVTHYRQSEWIESHATLEKSLQSGIAGYGGTVRWEGALNWFFLAMCHQHMEQETEARKCYEKGVAWMGENQPNSELLVRVRIEAEELLGVSMSLASKSISELEKEAEDLSQAIKLTPNRWEAWNDRALYYFNRKQWSCAVADYTKAIALENRTRVLWFHRGQAYLELGQGDNAVADLTRVVEGWPDNPSGWYSRGVAYAQLKQTDKALDDLRQAIAMGYRDLEQMRSEPNLAPLRSNRDFKYLVDPGWALLRQERFAEAETEFRELIRQRPDHAPGHRGLGKALLGQNNFVDGIASLRESIRLDPANGYSYDTLAWALIGQTQYAEAEDAFRQVVELQSTLVSGHFGLSRALLEQGKFVEAEKSLREVLRLEPGHEWAPYLLRQALAGQGKQAEAEESIKEKSGDNPSEPVSETLR